MVGHLVGELGRVIPAGGVRNLVWRTAPSTMSSSLALPLDLAISTVASAAVPRDHELDPHRAEPARALGFRLGAAPAPRSGHIRARRRGWRLPARWSWHRWPLRCARRRRRPPGRRPAACSGAAPPSAPRGWRRPRGPAPPWAALSRLLLLLLLLALLRGSRGSLSGAPSVASTVPRGRGRVGCDRSGSRDSRTLGADDRHADGIDLLPASARHGLIGLTRHGVEHGRMRHQRHGQAPPPASAGFRRLRGPGSRCTETAAAGRPAAEAACRRPCCVHMSDGEVFHVLDAACLHCVWSPSGR